MMNPFVAVSVFGIEMLICYIFFSNVFEKKRSTRFSLLCGTAFAIIATSCNLLSVNSGVVNTITSIIVQCLFAYFCFNTKLYISFFYSLILVVINGTTELLVISAISSLLGIEFLGYNESLPHLIIVCSTCKSLYFLLVLIISRIANPSSGKKKLPLIFFLYPATGSICQILFWHINTRPGLPSGIQICLSIASVLHMISTILLFITYQHQLEKESQAIHMQNEVERLRVEKSYYDILEHQNQKLMIYAHDAKNHLAAIQSVTDDPQITQYLGSLSQQLADYTRASHSGNKMLDVMINKYTLECKNKDIDFHYDVKLCNLSVIEDIDLVAIVGNLMDNAILAAERSQLREVSLVTAKRNSYSIIIISNSYDVPPNLVAGNLVTTKANPSHHGYGLKSVKKSLKKYEGDFEWSYDEKQRTFTVTVMIGKFQKTVEL